MAILHIQCTFMYMKSMILPGFSVASPWAFIWFSDENGSSFNLNNNKWNLFPNKRPWHGAPMDGRCHGKSR